MWAAVAHTDIGNVPGKARDGKCWYPYAGFEYETTKFSYLGTRPPHGYTKELGNLWACLCENNRGWIPGYVDSKGTAYYECYGAQTTKSFKLLKGHKTQKNTNGLNPISKEDSYNLYAVIANTPYGKIPAKYVNSTCWYTYNKQSHSCGSYEFLDAKI